MNKPIKENGVSVLFEAMVGGTGSSAIESQEKRGSRQLCASEALPTELIRGTEEQLAAIGVIVGEPFENDPIFRPATLPSGWKIVPTSHNMWTYLVDDQERRRAAIFYKAAFYDRKAEMSLECCYCIVSGSAIRYENAEDCIPNCVLGDDDSVVVKTGARGELREIYRVVCPIAYPDKNTEDRVARLKEFWKAEKEARRKVRAWIDENYPEHSNPAFYW